MTTTDTAAPLTVSEAAEKWEKAKAFLADSAAKLFNAQLSFQLAKADEATARKDFDAAYAAMRPVKPRKPKAEGGAV